MKLLLIFFIAILIHQSQINAGANELFIKNCATCHSVQKGDKTLRAGPNLWGVFGAKAGQVEGYRYSDYLKNSDIVWTREALQAWLSDRKTRVEYFGKEVKDTKMMWTGIKKEEDMKTILDYLEKMK